MTVRIVRAPWHHPLECPVCESEKQVRFSRLFTFDGQRVASQLTAAIPCPQCSTALWSLLPRDTGG